MYYKTTTDRPIDYDGDGDYTNDIDDDYRPFIMNVNIREDNTFNEDIMGAVLYESLQVDNVHRKGTWILNSNENSITFNYTNNEGVITYTDTYPISIPLKNRFEMERVFYDVHGKFNAKVYFSRLN